MFTSTHRNRRFGAAAALLTAALASATIASSASAQQALGDPDLFTLSPTSWETKFGTVCQVAGDPLSDAALVWNLDAAGDITPQVTGDICVQPLSNSVQAQIVIEYYDDDHEVAATRLSKKKTGNGGLDVFPVDRGELTFGSANIDHVHVVLMDDRANPGTLDQVDMTALDLGTG